MELNDSQVENWRNVLLNFIGPAALILPSDRIKKIAGV